MSELETEIQPEVAKANAQANFDRLAAELPASVRERENGLPDEIARESGSAIRKLRRLYRAMEEISAVIAPYVACRAGCTSCCHYAVHLYPLEAELIEKRTAHKRLAFPAPAGDFHGLPCPFLAQGRCGIYEDRPMSCRQHFALTNSAYWCEPTRSDQIQLPMVRLSAAAESFEKIVQKDGRMEALDIRQVFGTAARI